MDTEEKRVEVITDRVTEITCSKCVGVIDVADVEPFAKVECADCGNWETVPVRLGQFLLLDLIGTGGMGGVYYAKDESLSRFVAIKVMLKSLSENREFVASFRHEAQAVAKLNHPNIVQIYSFGETKGQLYIVMELVSGQRFDNMLAERKQLDQVLVMHVALDVAKGLSAADEIGLIHGDIKPENILLDEKMQAKLVDFGLATYADQAAVKGIWGTPYYIAPEKVKGQKADVRSDIYSLGATFYHALAARPPFEGKTPIQVVKARLYSLPEQLHVLCPKINKDVEAIISRMLEPDPSKRYPTYASLISDIRKALAKLGPSRSFVTLAKTKKMFVAKKRSSPIAVDVEMAKKGGGAKPPPGPARIVIPQKSTLSSDVLSEYRKRSTAVSQPAGKKQRSLAALWITLVILLVLAGTGIGLFIKHKKDLEVRAAREAIALTTQVNAAKEIHGKIELVATNVFVMADSVWNHVEKATNAVFAVLGETMEVHEPSQTNEPAPRAEPAKKPTPAVGAEPAVAKPADGRDAPVGIMPLEQLQALHSTASTGAVPFAVSSNAVAQPEVPPAKLEEPAAEPQEPVKEPTIKVLARKVVSCANKISEKREAVRKIVETALETRNQAFEATTEAIAMKKVEDLSAHLSTAQSIEDEAKEALLDAEKAAQEADTIKVKFEEERQAQRKAEEEEVRRKAEEEAQRRKIEEHRALIEKELNLAEAARSSSLPLIEQHQYKEAVEALTAQLAGYQTDEGKNAIKILIERYSRLHGLKMFIIERLNADPFSYGVGKGTFARDALGADEFGVKTGIKIIPWTEIPTWQMKKFMDHYLLGPGSQKVKLNVLGEQSLAAAIFCYENGGTEAAAAYAQKTVLFCPTLEQEVKRLVPLQ